MNAYLARTKTEILNLAVRALSEEAAKGLLNRNDVEALLELTPEVASVMNVPTEEGIYCGLVWVWLSGPTNLLGELRS